MRILRAVNPAAEEHVLQRDGAVSPLASRETGLYRLVWALLPVGMARKTAIPRLEESLSIAKRSVVTGRVRVRKTVRKRRQTLDIPVKREEAVVRRVPVNRV